MHSWKAMIVDPCKEFRTALARQLEPEFLVAVCSHGDEALALIRQEMPDVLILELSLPGLDGIGLLRQLAHRPQILVVSDFLDTPFVRGSLLQLGIQYALRKPCPVHTVAERARDLMAMEHNLALSRSAYQLLDSLGLPCGRQGFQHLLTGLPILAADRDQRLEKELYRQIALQNRATPGSVEKAIRDTIRSGWESGNQEVWNRCFPGHTRCPRNKEFLFRLADLLRRGA